MVELDSHTVVTERRMLFKQHTVLKNVSHLFCEVLVNHRITFSQRLFPSKSTTELHVGQSKMKITPVFASSKQLINLQEKKIYAKNTKLIIKMRCTAEKKYFKYAIVLP